MSDKTDVKIEDESELRKGLLASAQCSVLSAQRRGKCHCMLLLFTKAETGFGNFLPFCMMLHGSRELPVEWRRHASTQASETAVALRSGTKNYAAAHTEDREKERQRGQV